MRLFLVIAALALTGCSLFRKGDAEPLPVQPPGPTKPDVVATPGVRQVMNCNGGWFYTE